MKGQIFSRNEMKSAKKTIADSFSNAYVLTYHKRYNLIESAIGHSGSTKPQLPLFELYVIAGGTDFNAL